MRALFALDWSEQAFAAARQAADLYDFHEAVLVHGIDLGMFQSPMMAQLAGLQGYNEFRTALERSGTQLLDQAAELLSRDGRSMRRICTIAKPASLILAQAKALTVDLIVVGARGAGRAGELVLGSVSHRVALHADCSTLIVKDRSGPVRSVVVAVEGEEDAERLRAWFTAHPFQNPVDLLIFSVVQPIPSTDPFNLFPMQDWTDVAGRAAGETITRLAATMKPRHPTITTDVGVGDPVDLIVERARTADLLMIGSHSRKGLERFLLGSISHALLHRAPCPVLIVR